MNDFGIFRRRHLPHWDVDGYPVFITGCLHGSLPAAGLARIRQYREELETRKRPDKFTDDQWLHHIEKLVFAFVDKLLDFESPVTHLTDDRQAKIVQDAFLHFVDERYRLFAFVVMPCHHHWVFLPDEAWSIEAVKANPNRTPREIISHSVQSYTSNQCNRVRGVCGKYWQDETFDHWVRDDAEMLRIIQYIEQNPVVAGLVERAEDYPWSSAKIRAEKGIQIGQPITKP